jgi:phosphate starvation-inducible PhoH-like protein
MVYNNIIEISPLGFMRGRTFQNAYIIADEMQNSSPNQMLMLTTRIGKGSKMVVTGDIHQTDRGVKTSGLLDFIVRYDEKRQEQDNHEIQGIQIVELTKEDIERDPIIVTLLDIYGN